AYDKRDMSNPVWQYVAARNLLYRQGKKIELFCNYEPSYSFVGEWLKQLFGESEGKDGKGIFPASAQFTTDLHSLGQYIQDGERHLFETVIYVDDTGYDIAIPYSDDNGDNLNYLAGKPLSFVREMAFQGTLAAHQDGGAPSMVLRLDKMSVHALGELLYFFELSCGISGHVLGVNPFNQPGVEAYKKNMFALLGKP
ncbi:MAG: glucose-6-phosphate isomerase, partial [Oscillospiraceae bacterium]|nr:glucose-6-phosphate isomerase [Oscillospiraceae bacterium]